MIEKIVRMADARGLSQAAVEKLCGLSNARITKWEEQAKVGKMLG